HLSSHFCAAPNAPAPSAQVSASVWQSSRASPKHTTEPSPSPPEPPAVSVSLCNYPSRRTRTDDVGGRGGRRGPRERPRVPALQGHAAPTRRWRQRSLREHGAHQSAGLRADSLGGG